MQIAAESQIDLLTNSRKTALLYRNAPLPQIPHMLLCVASAYINISLGAQWWPAVIWAMCAVAASLLRLTLSLLYRRQQPEAQEAELWQRRYFRATMLSGLIWGIGTAYFMFSASEIAQTYNALILC